MALKPGQQKCINTLDRSIVVAAGAGSGKTFTLTKRIVHAIQSGAVDGIHRVCAITFTNKAAGELKSRIKSELRACGLLEQALQVDDAWVSTIHGMCARILRAHALELDIDPQFKMADVEQAKRLRDQSINEILRLAQSGELFEETTSNAQSGEPSERLTSNAQPGEPFARLIPSAIDALFAEYSARTYGLRGTSVELMLQVLMGMAGGNPRGFDAFAMPREDAPVNPAQLVSHVLETYEALVEATAGQKPSATRQQFVEETTQRITAIRREMDAPATVNLSDPLWALRALDSLPTPKRVGTADYKVQAGEALDLHRTCVMLLRLDAAAPHLRTLVVLARAASQRYAQVKRREGVLDNDDLLVLAHRAITDHPQIAAQYTDKFQLIMVDEFQDTDQMQVDMIKRLAGPGACRLCTVGDAQQSIYRFRGADVSVYRRHLQQVRAVSQDDVIMLPDNFRSHRDVLSLVDRVFQRPEMFGGEFMSLAPGRDEARVKRPFAQGMPRVQVLLTTKAHGGAPLEQVRQVAAERIADAFVQLREQGHQAGEMAVLLGGMANADVYARALRSRGLACVISGGSVFSSAPEAGIVLDLARVVANPYQTQSLFNVLTSPLFQLSAGDLLQLSTRMGKDGLPRRRDLCDGLLAYAKILREEAADDERDAPVGAHSVRLDTTTDYERETPAAAAAAASATTAVATASAPCSPQLQLAVRVMGQLMRGSGRSTVSRLIMRAVVDSGWISRLQACGAEGLASAANVYKAIRMVESIEAEQAVGPAQVARLFQVTLEESREAPGALSASGGDFVRIMTVHSSKGLEFPIVAVAEFKDPSGPSGKLLACQVDGTVRLSLDLGNTGDALQGAAKPKEMPALFAKVTEGCADEDDLLRAIADAEDALQLRAALYEHERLGDAEEAKRLLYVALTRAKEALIVSLLGQRTKDNPHGTPKNCLGALIPALTGDDAEGPGGFEVGVSHLDFGGTAPAFVEHVAVEKDDTDASRGDALRTPVSQLDNESQDETIPAPTPDAFAIPAPSQPAMVSRTLYKPAHEGVFSYSSIAEASHEGDVLDFLADRFFVSADQAGEDFGSSLGEYGESDAFAWSTPVTRANRNAAVTDEDDGSWAYTGSLSGDADKATDLGTAFHRLAQLSVVLRGGEGLLECPAPQRVRSLSRACNLDGIQRERLGTALHRWFNSDLAQEMAALQDLAPEVPFFVSVPISDTPVGAHSVRLATTAGDTGESLIRAHSVRLATTTKNAAYLEGEIDLLGFNAVHDIATVVDYKTGGSASETIDDLRCKHVLQAACYAYAIMLQGAKEVQAIFVRVERPCADDPAQPQCVRYRFTRDDLPTLQQSIAHVYQLRSGE